MANPQRKDYSSIQVKEATEVATIAESLKPHNVVDMDEDELLASMLDGLSDDEESFPLYTPRNASADDELDDLLDLTDEEPESAGEKVSAVVVPFPVTTRPNVSATTIEQEPEPEPALEPSKPRLAPSKSKAQSELDLYRFPSVDPNEVTTLDNLSDAYLIAELRTLIAKLPKVQYVDVRHRFAALHYVLTARGIIAPSCRPQAALPQSIQGFKRDPNQTVMLRDREIMDMLWHHRKGKRDELEGVYVSLFSGCTLDMELAERLSGTKGSSEKKVATLKLTELEELASAVTRSEKVRLAWKNTLASAGGSIERKLREKKRIARDCIPAIKNLWLVNKITGHKSLAERAEVLSWLTGEKPTDPVTLGKDFQAMRRQVK